jgi:hypothetical protein
MGATPPERVAVLILRAWFEGPERRLVARVTGTPDVVDRPATTRIVGSIEDLHEAVQDWLDGMQSG